MKWFKKENKYNLIKDDIIKSRNRFRVNGLGQMNILNGDIRVEYQNKIYYPKLKQYDNLIKKLGKGV